MSKKTFKKILGSNRLMWTPFPKNLFITIHSSKEKNNLDKIHPLSLKKINRSTFKKKKKLRKTLNKYVEKDSLSFCNLTINLTMNFIFLV